MTSHCRLRGIYSLPIRNLTSHLSQQSHAIWNVIIVKVQITTMTTGLHAAQKIYHFLIQLQLHQTKNTEKGLVKKNLHNYISRTPCNHPFC